MKHAEELRAARARKKLSQRELANLIGLTQQMVSAWENGEPIAREHWEKLKQSLDIDLESMQDDNIEQVTTNTILGGQIRDAGVGGSNPLFPTI